VGLDTSHGAFSGAYSSFTKWRADVARAAGYTVSLRKDAVSGFTYHDLGYDDRDYHDANYMGIWAPDEEPDDILLVLLVHSDCSGVIDRRHVPFLAARLEELLPRIREMASSHAGDDSWSSPSRTTLFIAGLNAAARARDEIEFY
jgi:hypothetical protein